MKEELLDVRYAMYSLLALLYRGEISEGLTAVNEYSAILRMAGQYQPELDNEIRRLQEDIGRQFGDSGYAAAVADDYRQLFAGPGPILAPPWESVYRTKEKLLFGEPETAVRHFYQSAGLTVKKSEPADHIALELAFLARLCAKKTSAQQPDPDSLHLQNKFLVMHVSQWVKEWAADVEAKAQTTFWRTLARLTYQWVLSDNLSLQGAPIKP